MRLTLLLIVAIHGSESSGIAQCGAHYSDKQKQECQVSLTIFYNIRDWFQDKAAKKAETCTSGCTTEWSPPYCGADSACQASEIDECSFQCIEKPSCEGCLYEYMIGDQLYCDCNKKCDPPRFDMFWSCDNTGYGF